MKYIICLSILLALGACNSDNNTTGGGDGGINGGVAPLNPGQIKTSLTGSSWSERGVIFQGNYQPSQACDADDVFYFVDDKNYQYTENTPCSNTDVDSSGTWNVVTNAAGKVMLSLVDAVNGPLEMEIVSVSGTEARYNVEATNNGQPITITIIMDKI
ncbi:MAG: hypothetical protein HOE90_20165 [Bacteriovoracaceae bacterium]|jgi:hypothetical protein|nr:hypothetical protein [Bacteriovoracaceae bacterium]